MKIGKTAEILDLLHAFIGAMTADFRRSVTRHCTAAWPGPAPVSHYRFFSTSGKNPAMPDVAPRVRQSPAGAALRPDWHVRILTGFLAFCTRRTRVAQRLRR